MYIHRLEERLACVDDRGLLEERCRALQQQVNEMEVHPHTHIPPPHTHTLHLVRSFLVIMEWFGSEVTNPRHTQTSK